MYVDTASVAINFSPSTTSTYVYLCHLSLCRIIAATFWHMSSGFVFSIYGCGLWNIEVYVGPQFLGPAAWTDGPGWTRTEGPERMDRLERTDGPRQTEEPGRTNGPASGPLGPQTDRP